MTILNFILAVTIATVPLARAESPATVLAKPLLATTMSQVLFSEVERKFDHGITLGQLAGLPADALSDLQQDSSNHRLLVELRSILRRHGLDFCVSEAEIEIYRQSGRLPPVDRNSLICRGVATTRLLKIWRWLKAKRFVDLEQMTEREIAISRGMGPVALRQTLDLARQVGVRPRPENNKMTPTQLPPIAPPSPPAPPQSAVRDGLSNLDGRLAEVLRNCGLTTRSEIELAWFSYDIILCARLGAQSLVKIADVFELPHLHLEMTNGARKELTRLKIKSWSELKFGGSVSKRMRLKARYRLELDAVVATIDAESRKMLAVARPTVFLGPTALSLPIPRPIAAMLRRCGIEDDRAVRAAYLTGDLNLCDGLSDSDFDSIRDALSLRDSVPSLPAVTDDVRVLLKNRGVGSWSQLEVLLNRFALQNLPDSQARLLRQALDAVRSTRVYASHIEFAIREGESMMPLDPRTMPPLEASSLRQGFQTVADLIEKVRANDRPANLSITAWQYLSETVKVILKDASCGFVLSVRTEDP